MENVVGLCDYLDLKPKMVKCLEPPEKNQMRRAFWGEFPICFLPSDYTMKVKRLRKEVKRNYEVGVADKPEERAEIPFVFSRALARAIRAKLEIV